MLDFEMRLGSVQDVQDFVDIASTRPFTITVRDARNKINAQFFCVFRSVLCVAAAHGDHRIGMFPAATADQVAVFLVRHGGDGAGVDNIPIAGRFKSGNGMPPGNEKLLHCLGFVLVHLATKGVKSECHNITKKKDS